MATRIHFPPIPASVAALPFLFMPGKAGDRDRDFNAALGSAISAEEAVCERRNTHRRVAWLLCELALQYGRRTGDFGEAVPLSRAELARALRVNLFRVKRALALLSLSDAIASEGDAVRVLDWRRLCVMAGYDIARLAFALPEEENAPAGEEEAPLLLTAAGDPAYFA